MVASEDERREQEVAILAIAIVAEDRGTDRPGNEPHRVDGECLQHADQGIGVREEELAEDETGHRAVEQEIVLFDGRADRTGNDGASQLCVMIGLGQRANGGVDHCH